MAINIVVGGQYGDEGKGKIISYLALEDKPEVVARGGGGPNAGHTVEYKAKKYKIRLVPSGFVYKEAKLVIGPGVLIDPEVFLEEIKNFEVEGRCFVDRMATIIEPKHKEEDASSEIAKKIGTTKSGIGPATAHRALRDAKLAYQEERLGPYLTDCWKIVNSTSNLLVEGSQGFMLSNLHGTYPYCTAKDVSASAICSEIGLGPKKVDNVIMVIKSYTTRVGSGPLEGEISPEQAKKLGMDEYGTVTGRQRRVNPNLIWQELKKAVIVNSATFLALTKLDVKYPQAKGLRDFQKLPKKAQDFVFEIEKKLNVPVALIGTGPDAQDIIDRRKELGIKK
ncbi:MAG: adenylosuccinate synthetase [Candidatus Micrarchaeota archaeon]|nr:adenylosuccinate synthetase [Candidatus Micrarchaeota archaeon]